jgi:hypothetical protein
MMALRRIVLLYLVTPIVVVQAFSGGSGGGTRTLIVTIGQPRPSKKKKNSASSSALAFASAAVQEVVQKKEKKIFFLRQRQETPPNRRRFQTALQYGERSGVDAQLLFDSWVSTTQDDGCRDLGFVLAFWRQRLLISNVVVFIPVHVFSFLFLYPTNQTTCPRRNGRPI